MLKGRATYPIGIDIGTRHIYAAQLKQVRDGVAVSGLVRRELNGEAGGVPEAGDAMVAILRDIARNKQFAGKRVVLRLPAEHTLCFPISFEVGRTEVLEDGILRELKQHLPFPAERAIIDYPSIKPPAAGGGNSYKAIIVAARRDLVEQYLLIFKRAGLSVEAIDFGISSLIRLHRYLFPLEQEPIVMCSIGHTRSVLSIVTKDDILAYLDVPWGIDILLERIQANLGLLDEQEKTRIILKKYGLLYEDRETYKTAVSSSHHAPIDSSCRAIYQIITPQIEEWIFDFYKIIAYLRSEDHDINFAGIYMYGCATLIPRLDHYLEKRLNIPTKLVNPLATLALSGGSVLPDISEGGPFSLALGLGMRKVSWL